MNKLHLGALIATVFAASVANGAVINYTDYSAWSAAAGAHTTLNFVGLASGTPVTNQYSGLGATFSGAESLQTGSFVNDGYGIFAPQGDPIVLNLTTPSTAIATHYPGAVMFKLYMDANLIGVSDNFGGSGTGFFGGIVSDAAFNKVEFFDWYINPGYYDDIHYNAGESAVPGPAAAIPFVLGMLALKRRRR